MPLRPAPAPSRARLRVAAGAVLVLVLGGLAIAVLVTALTPRGGSGLVTAPTPSGRASPAASGAASAGMGGAAQRAAILVHVLGEVQRPGLYELRAGDRVVDAVAAAGGLTDAADPAGLNLARPVVDGEQLVVPVPGAGPPAASTATGTGSAPGAAVGPINLNTADAAALDTLPRIGPATAQRILDWRAANGPFRSVEDLLDVPGIGEATLAGLRDQVTV